MSEPLTDQERKAWRQTCLVADGPGPNRACNLRFGCLRYEATLQAKDAQITALVTAWQNLCQHKATHEQIVACAADIGDAPCECGYHDKLRSMELAIKEATCL